MVKQGKIWGDTEEIFRSDNVSINLLNIRKGGFCSEHYHFAKVNLFHIISGLLEIQLWPAGGTSKDKPDVTRIGAGDSTAIKAGVWHLFKAAEETVCLEIYTVSFNGEDIVRRSHGGVAK